MTWGHQHGVKMYCRVRATAGVAAWNAFLAAQLSRGCVFSGMILVQKKRQHVLGKKL